MHLRHVILIGLFIGSCTWSGGAWADNQFLIASEDRSDERFEPRVKALTSAA